MSTIAKTRVTSLEITDKLKKLTNFRYGVFGVIAARRLSENFVFGLSKAIKAKKETDDRKSTSGVEAILHSKAVADADETMVRVQEMIKKGRRDSTNIPPTIAESDGGVGRPSNVKGRDGTTVEADLVSHEAAESIAREAVTAAIEKASVAAASSLAKGEA